MNWKFPDESRVRAALNGPHKEVLKVIALQPVRASCRIDALGQPVPVPRSGLG